MTHWPQSHTMARATFLHARPFHGYIYQQYALTSCGSISGHLVTIPYQIIKHIPTSALLEA